MKNIIVVAVFVFVFAWSSSSLSSLIWSDLFVLRSMFLFSQSWTDFLFVSLFHGPFLFSSLAQCFSSKVIFQPSWLRRIKRSKWLLRVGERGSAAHQAFVLFASRSSRECPYEWWTSATAQFLEETTRNRIESENRSWIDSEHLHGTEERHLSQDVRRSPTRSQRRQSQGGFSTRGDQTIRER